MTERTYISQPGFGVPYREPGTKPHFHPSPEQMDMFLNSNDPNTRVLAKLRIMTSGFEAVQSMINQHNNFSNQRDYFREFGYKKGQISHLDKIFKYKRADLAGRVVDAEPWALWSYPPEIVGPDEAWLTRWKRVTKLSQLWYHLSRLDKIAGLDPYAILVMGVTGQSSLKTPIENRGRPRNPTDDNPSGAKDVIYLQPYSSTTATITSYDEDITSPTFGKPKMYEINVGQLSLYKQAQISNQDGPVIRQISLEERRGIINSVPENIASLGARPNQGNNPNRQQRKVEVHMDYVVHVVENALEDEVFGFPRIERIYNLLDDMLKVGGSNAEAFWHQAYKGLQIDVDKEVELNPQDAENLESQIDEFINNYRRVIQTKGVTVTPLEADTVDPTGHFNVLINLMSAATGIPKRILFGAEAGQLASQQDRANWAERIEQRRSLYGEPVILVPLINKLMALGVLPTTDMTELEFKWPDAHRLGPLEIAEVQAREGRALQNLQAAAGGAIIEMSALPKIFANKLEKEDFKEEAQMPTPRMPVNEQGMVPRPPGTGNNQNDNSNRGRDNNSDNSPRRS